MRQSGREEEARGKEQSDQNRSRKLGSGHLTPRLTRSRYGDPVARDRAERHTLPPLGMPAVAPFATREWARWDSVTAQDLDEARFEPLGTPSPTVSQWRVADTSDVVGTIVDEAARHEASLICLAADASGCVIDALQPTITGHLGRWSPRTPSSRRPALQQTSQRYAEVVECIDGASTPKPSLSLVVRRQTRSGPSHESSTSPTPPRH